MKLNKKIKDYIKFHAEKEFPKECCGFIVEKNGDIFCLPLINHSKNKDNFTISPIDFINIKSNHNIICIYHSHTDKLATEFSNADINCAKHLMYNLLVYIMELDIYKIYNFISGEVQNG